MKGSYAGWKTRAISIDTGTVIFAVLLVGLICPNNAEPAGSSVFSTPTGMKDVPPEWAGVYTTILTTNLLPPRDAEVNKHLQPWAVAKQQATSWGDDREALCELSGFSNPTTFGIEIKVIPSPGKLTIFDTIIEEGGVRRIHLNRPHPNSSTPTWNGDSIAQWDGDTLVVDTVGLTDESWLMQERQPHTDALHIVERMRMILGGKYLEIETTVYDPKALTSPYMYRRYYERSDSEMRENVCNEYSAAANPWRRQKEAADRAAAALAAATAPSRK